MSESISGFVNFDKPAGWTSFDVVNKVRNTLEKEQRRQTGERKRIKVGHSGTLDPFATGLLRLGFGDCTKKLGDMTKLDKTYEGIMLLGWTSTTGDVDGGLTKLAQQTIPQQSEVEHALKGLEGAIQQIPPAHSAVKVGGVRAYRLARQGEEPELRPRQVRVFSFKLKKYQYPKVKFECRVSSGTYVRVLATEVGKALGTDAYLEELRRTKIADFSVDGALNPETAEYKEILEKSSSCL